MTNPFLQPQAAQPAEQQQNPFAQPQQPQQPAQQPGGQPNPFAPGVPAQQPATAPQAYTPQVAQQQAPAATVPTPPPPALNPRGLVGAPPPPPSGDGKGAKLAHMYGRLVLVFPLAVARVAKNPQFITQEQRQRGEIDQDRMTATVVVLDDGAGGMSPIEFGGAPWEMPPKPNTEREALPYVRKGMWINQAKLIEQLRPFLPQPGGAPGMVCGRVVKAGPTHQDPWYLQGATEQELGLATVYLDLVAKGQYPHPLA